MELLFLRPKTLIQIGAKFFTFDQQRDLFKAVHLETMNLTSIYAKFGLRLAEGS